MEGTLLIQEKRSTIDKFRDWYQRKIVASGFSEKFEKIVEGRTKFAKKTNELAEKVLPPIIARIPEVSFLAPLIPALSRVANLEAELEKAIILKAKRFIENVFIGVDGSCSEISLSTINLDGLGQDMDAIVNGINGGLHGENPIAEEQEYTEGYGMKR